MTILLDIADPGVIIRAGSDHTYQWSCPVSRSRWGLDSSHFVEMRIPTHIKSFLCFKLKLVIFDYSKNLIILFPFYVTQ